MPKLLYLLRHADAPAQIPNTARHLDDIGMKECSKLAQYFQLHQNPDKIIVSPALRTVQTLENVFPHPPQVTVNNELYRATADDILGIIAGCVSSTNRLMIIGHNPAITKTALNLHPECDLPYKKIMDDFSITGKLVAINFHMEKWPDIFVTKGKVADAVSPLNYT